ncbi:hypothetical protein DPMN_085295 [Dreissena polymorpha]|uniref:Uncharacterized protein n=1 Tax=Dreissena polymorpha TaxID=45954 RepID=A0A9D3YFX0_DREPO|nr:hypothetical protein DPMN_085295 [Dreissena polymorpha]
MMHTSDIIKVLVKACVLLHNLLRTRYPKMQTRLFDWVLGEKARTLKTQCLIEHQDPTEMSG